MRDPVVYSKILNIAAIEPTTASTTANMGAAIASIMASIIISDSVQYPEFTVNVTNYLSKAGLLHPTYN